MNAKQYREALQKLNLSQVAAGELFGVGARTSRRWALDQARIPTAVEMLLNMMVHKKLELKAPIINEENDAYKPSEFNTVWTFSVRAKREAIEA